MAVPTCSSINLCVRLEIPIIDAVKKIVVEFHCHTCFSGDSSISIADLITKSRELGIDKIVISDHNSIQGAIEAKNLAPDLILIGEEIWTPDGEILAVFIENEVPRGVSVYQAFKLLRDQNAFVIAPHPFDSRRNALDLASLGKSTINFLDAIEVYNGRCSSAANAAAAEFAHLNDCCCIGGSDAHNINELGLVTMELPLFDDVTDLRRVIRSGIIRAKSEKNI